MKVEMEFEDEDGKKRKCETMDRTITLELRRP